MFSDIFAEESTRLDIILPILTMACLLAMGAMTEFIKEKNNRKFKFGYFSLLACAFLFTAVGTVRAYNQQQNNIPSLGLNYDSNQFILRNDRYRQHLSLGLQIQ